jgi:hypothetical protein
MYVQYLHMTVNSSLSVSAVEMKGHRAIISTVVSLSPLRVVCGEQVVVAVDAVPFLFLVFVAAG